MTSVDPIMIQGIAGEQMQCDKRSKFMGMDVYYNPEEIVNILSWKTAGATMELEWDREKDEFRAVTLQGKVLVFRCTDGGYILLLIATVHGNLMDYTKR